MDQVQARQYAALPSPHEDLASCSALRFLVLQAGIMTPNEARESISLPPRTEGDVLVSPKQSTLQGNERKDSGSHSSSESNDTLRNSTENK